MDVARRLTIRLTESQWEVVEAASRALSVPAAEVVRGAVETLADRLPAQWAERAQSDPAQTDALSALRLEVRRIGVNVNQCVRLMHRADMDVNAAEVLAQLGRIYAALDELEEAVSGVDRDGG